MAKRELDSSAGAIRLGVSACPPRAPVRFDGSHKRDRFLTDSLGRQLTYLAGRSYLQPHPEDLRRPTSA